MLGPRASLACDLRLGAESPAARVPARPQRSRLAPGRGSGEGPLSSCRQNSSTPSKHRRGPQAAWAPPPEARGPASVGTAADGEGSFLPTGGGSHLHRPQWRPSGGSDSHRPHCPAVRTGAGPQGPQSSGGHPGFYLHRQQQGPHPTSAEQRQERQLLHECP